MNGISAIGANDTTGMLFGRSRVNIRSYGERSNNLITQQTLSSSERLSTSTLRKVVRLQDALQELKSSRFRTVIRNGNSGVSAVAATAISQPLDFGSATTTVLTSVEEINTAPTSFTQFGPNLVGSTVTAPWSGPGSTADATVSGAYDGSNGSGTLTFRVDREGTHGEDDLKIKVYDPDDSLIETISIKKNDPLNKVYSLSNGLNVTLGAGDLVKNDEFTVDTTLLNTSFTPSLPNWTGSTATSTIGGTYDGSNGTGDLTFRVDRAGTHGEKDLKLKVYAPDDSFIQDITIKKNDAIDKVYSLDNGLTLSLSAGDLIKHETFTVGVDAADPGATGPAQPPWILSSAAVSIGGTYDGSLGTGTVTFVADKNGTRGVDDLRVKAYAPDGSFLENIDIAADDPVDTTYLLSSGLTFSLSDGDLIKGETFTVDVQASTSFSTSPNPLESTAEVTMGGVYDGTQGTGTLSFLITQAGTHGVDNLALEVYAPDNTLIETINVLQTDSPDQVYSLSNGLTFQLSAGMLALNETFEISVNDQIGSRVNPDMQFDGTRNDNPNLDIGLQVTAGSFDVNGVTIDVFANDTLNTVLDRITQSDNDVTATFDADSETVVLTRDTAVGEDIVVNNDSSGFLIAAKLATAVSVNPGQNTTTPIGEIASLNSVSSGAIEINGVSISLDVTADSLDDVIDRINNSAANATAAFDQATNQISITTNDSTDLVLSSGSTGFFETLEIASGTYKSVVGRSARTPGLGQQSRQQIATLVGRVSKAINKLFEDPEFGEAVDESLATIRSSLQKEIAASFESTGPEFQTDLGVAFNFAGDAKQVFRFSNADRTELLSSLKTRKGVHAFRDLLFEKEQKQNPLVDRLLEATKEISRDMVNELGTIGVMVDILA